MVRSIKASPKYILVSTCLLLVLVAGIMAQTAAQSTNTSVDLTVYGLTGPLGGGSSGQPVWFEVVVNGRTYCIFGYQTSFYSDPINVTLNEGSEGPCGDGIEYVGAGGGGLVTSGYHPSSGFVVTGYFTIVLLGPGPTYPFTLVVNLVAGGITIQSTVTGNLNNPGSGCTLSDIVSKGTSVTGAGVNLNIQLLSYTGTCGVPGPPWTLSLALTFGNAAIVPVGGVVIPVNKFAVLAPWLALIGLVGCIGTVFVVAKKRLQ